MENGSSFDFFFFIFKNLFDVYSRIVSGWLSQRVLKCGRNKLLIAFVYLLFMAFVEGLKTGELISECWL